VGDDLGSDGQPFHRQTPRSPELPHVDLSDLPRSGTRKLMAVTQYVGDRAVAWIDDELYEDALAWAADRTVPTILRRTSAGVGLTEPDVRALDAFQPICLSLPPNAGSVRVGPSFLGVDRSRELWLHL
jgi:hypothetical protein